MKTKNVITIFRLITIYCLFLVISINGYSQGCHGGSSSSGSNNNHSNHSVDKNVDATSKYKTTYSCSMHPEVVTDLPGKCPKCGMDMDKKVTKNADNTKSSKKKYYACKIHSNIKSDIKGLCSICGKKLKKKVDYIY